MSRGGDKEGGPLGGTGVIKTRDEEVLRRGKDEEGQQG